MERRSQSGLLFAGHGPTKHKRYGGAQARPPGSHGPDIHNHKRVQCYNTEPAALYPGDNRNDAKDAARTEESRVCERQPLYQHPDPPGSAKRIGRAIPGPSVRRTLMAAAFDRTSVGYAHDLQQPRCRHHLLLLVCGKPKRREPLPDRQRTENDKQLFQSSRLRY